MRYVECYSTISKKKRRHSGWVTPETTLKAKRKWLIDNCLEPQPFYDEWKDHRDGFRDHNNRTKITSCPRCIEHYGFAVFNKKNKRLIKRREAMKKGRSCYIRL